MQEQEILEQQVMQEIQGTQEIMDLEELQEIQEIQEIMDLVEPQEIQEIQEIMDLVEPQEIQEMQEIREELEGQEIFQVVVVVEQEDNKIFQDILGFLLLGFPEWQEDLPLLQAVVQADLGIHLLVVIMDQQVVVLQGELQEMWEL